MSNITSLQIGQKKIQLAPRANLGDENVTTFTSLETTINNNTSSSKVTIPHDGVLRVHGAPNSSENSSLVIYINGKEAYSNAIRFDIWLNVRKGDKVHLQNVGGSTSWVVIHCKLYHYE